MYVQLSTDVLYDARFTTACLDVLELGEVEVATGPTRSMLLLTDDDLTSHSFMNAVIFLQSRGVPMIKYQLLKTLAVF